MNTPTPTALYIEAAKVTLPLDGLPDKVLAGFMCPLCRKVHAPEPGADVRAAALACCWCERHNERKRDDNCMSCFNERYAAHYAKREVDKAEERKAAYASAKPWDGQEIVPVDWEGPDDVHQHPDGLFEDIADREYPNPVTLDDLPVMAYVVHRKPLFDASEIAHEALGHEIDVSAEAVDALQAALDAWSSTYGYNRIEPGEMVCLAAERASWWAEYEADPCEGFDDDEEETL